MFDGEKTEPYTEEDTANPISVYGESKLEGERRVLAVTAIILSSAFHGSSGPTDRALSTGSSIARERTTQVEAVADKFSTPTYTLDIAEMLRPLIEQQSGARGIIHLANRGRVQLAGVWPMGDRLLRGGRCSAESDDRRRRHPGGHEELHRAPAGSHHDGDDEVYGMDRARAPLVARRGRRIRARLHL